MAHANTIAAEQADPPSAIDASARGPAGEAAAAVIEGSALGSASGDAISGRASDGDPFPCSIAQERLWLLDRVAPDRAALNIAFRWELRGSVDAMLLQTAWQLLVDRHEILRTIFSERDGKPLQVVKPQHPFLVVERDLSRYPAEQRDVEGERLAEVEARTRFDLARGPLLRVTRLRFTDDHSVLLVTAHQIVADGWSMGILARELGLALRALIDRQPVALEPLPLQYADYSEWHLAWMQERGTAAEEAWWTARLADFKPFRFPPDTPLQTEGRRAQGALVTRTLPAATMTAAQALASQQGATLFAAALAALAAVLHRYTGETDISLGMLVTDREQVELEGLVGQFVNALILRNDLSGDPGFATLVERARDTSAEALEHRHIPIERLLSIAGSACREPQTALVSVNFVFQRAFIEAADHGPFQLSELPSLPTDPLYDLTVYLVEDMHGWQLTAQYDDSVYQRAGIERLLGYFERVLESGCRQPDRPLSMLPMLGADERRQLQADGPDQQAFPALRGLHARFAAQVLARPDEIAVRCGEQTLTGRRLDGEAGRLAGYLRERGVGAGSRVGLCLRRGLDLPVALLALLRLGASWIVLDPDDSRTRIGLIVESARLETVIVRGGQWALLPGRALVRIDLDADAQGIAAARPAAPTDITPDREACAHPCARDVGRIAIRSISHAALETALMALAARPGLASGDTLIATTPASHPFAVVELLLPLLVGARLELVDGEALERPELLLHRIGARPGLVLPGTPPSLSRWLAATWEPGLRVRAWCHGERLAGALAQQLLARCGEVWTLYAPPEAAICAAIDRLARVEDLAVLGTAMPGTQLRVLGVHRELLPIGAIGELHVGGISLPMGTDPAPALADRLIEAEGLDSGGARLLRTNDLVRVRSDGRIVWCGRNDRRVQIDGQWVEPAEVEAHLLRHPSIAEAAVMLAPAADAPDGRLQLTAWIVLANDLTAEDAAAARALIDAHAERLPLACRPVRRVIVEALPKTPAGVIDWRRLLRADRPRTEQGGALDSRIIRIAALWSELLGRDDLDADSHFFELGGHSLLAARMLRRVEQEFGRRIDLAALFAAPTVRALAELLGSQDARDFDFRQVVRLQPNGTRLPMIAINNTGVYYLLARRLGDDQPVTSLQLFDPALGVEAMPDSIEEIAGRYVELIERVQPDGPYLLMGWCVAGALAFETARQLQARGKQVAHLYLMDAWAPNYLDDLPLFRRIVNDRSLRLRHLLDDLRHQLKTGGGLGRFLANRPMIQRLRRMLGLDAAIDGTRSRAAPRADPAGYDRWLLDYLQALSNRYQPQPFDGPITLFRSREEPTGLWFDPLAGWQRHARGGIRLEMIEGDHFSMFRDPGAGQMARAIRADHPA